MTDPVERRLADVRRRLARDRQRAKQSEVELAAAVAEAVAAGWSYPQIGEALGLTRQRVHQIQMGRRRH